MVRSLIVALGAMCLLPGCAAVAVTSAAVGSAVSVTASVVGVTVDAGAAVVRAAIPDND